MFNHQQSCLWYSCSPLPPLSLTKFLFIVFVNLYSVYTPTKTDFICQNYSSEHRVGEQCTQLILASYSQLAPSHPWFWNENWLSQKVVFSVFHGWASIYAYPVTFSFLLFSFLLFSFFFCFFFFFFFSVMSHNLFHLLLKWTELTGAVLRFLLSLQRFAKAMKLGPSFSSLYLIFFPSFYKMEFPGVYKWKHWSVYSNWLQVTSI